VADDRWSAADELPDFEDAPTEARPGFSIETEDDAANALEHVLSFTDRRRRLVEAHQRRMDNLDRREREVVSLKVPALRAWAEANRHPKRQSILLPTGVVKFTRHSARLTIDDDEAVKAWARVNAPQLLHEKPRAPEVKVYVDDVRDFVAKTKATIPGVKTIPAGETFKIEGVDDTKGDDHG
jgi:hypothetical protein